MSQNRKTAMTSPPSRVIGHSRTIETRSDSKFNLGSLYSLDYGSGVNQIATNQDVVDVLSYDPGKPDNQCVLYSDLKNYQDILPTGTWNLEVGTRSGTGWYLYVINLSTNSYTLTYQDMGDQSKIIRSKQTFGSGGSGFRISGSYKCIDITFDHTSNSGFSPESFIVYNKTDDYMSNYSCESVTHIILE